jgi:hypothetical protein
MQHLPLRLVPRVLLRKNPRETKRSLVSNQLTGSKSIGQIDTGAAASAPVPCGRKSVYAPVEKHSQEWSAELQIPRLRS